MMIPDSLVDGRSTIHQSSTQCWHLVARGGDTPVDVLSAVIDNVAPLVIDRQSRCRESLATSCVALAFDDRAGVCR